MTDAQIKTLIQKHGTVPRYSSYPTSDGPLITATETGKAFIRVIASAFDPYFSKQDSAKENRHAQAL